MEAAFYEEYGGKLAADTQPARQLSK